MEYTLAGVGQRMLAGLLDKIFQYTYLVLFIYFARQTFMSDGVFNNLDETYAQVRLGIFILLIVPVVFYHLLCETFLNGQSFGKKIIKIKVVKLDGTQPGFGSYFVRWIFRIIDDGVGSMNSIIGIISMASTKKAQRIGDLVAGTTVIEVKQKAGLADTILTSQEENYKIVYNQVAMISDADANIIKEVLDFSRKQHKPEHLTLLTSKIKTKYGISDVSQRDDEFLETLLRDYTHYQFER